MFVLDIYTKYQFTNIPHTYSNIQIPIYISICLSTSIEKHKLTLCLQFILNTVSQGHSTFLTFCICNPHFQ